MHVVYYFHHPNELSLVSFYLLSIWFESYSFKMLNKLLQYNIIVLNRQNLFFNCHANQVFRSLPSFQLPINHCKEHFPYLKLLYTLLNSLVIIHFQHNFGKCFVHLLLDIIVSPLPKRLLYFLLERRRVLNHQFFYIKTAVIPYKFWLQLVE